MQDPRAAIIHRLRFLNVVQQLARADVEAAVSAVGLDALAGTFAVSGMLPPDDNVTSAGVVRSGRLGASHGGGAARSSRSASKGRATPRNVTSAGTSTMTTRGTLFSTTYSSRQKSATNRGPSSGDVGREDTAGAGESDAFAALSAAFTPRGASSSGGERVRTAVGKRGASRGGRSGGAPSAGVGGPKKVADDDIELLRSMVMAGFASPSAGSSERQQAGGSVTWENQVGGGRSGALVKGPRYPLPQPANSPAALNETVRNNATTSSLMLSERPPIGPQQSLNSNTNLGTPVAGAAAASSSAGQGFPSLLAEGSPATPMEAEATSGMHLNATTSIGENTARSETPVLGGTRGRRGSAIKARPRPKAAHTGGGMGMGGQTPILPSDFTALDAEHRRLTQNTPMASPSPGGRSGQFANSTNMLPSPSRSAGGGAPVGTSVAVSIGGMSGASAPGGMGGSPGAGGFGSSAMDSLGLGQSQSRGELGLATPSGAGLTPLGRGGSGSGIASDFVDSPQKDTKASLQAKEREREEAARIEEERARENARVLAMAKLEAEMAAAVEEAHRVEQQQQSDMLSNLSSYIERMLGDHAAITDRHADFANIKAAGGGRAEAEALAIHKARAAARGAAAMGGLRVNGEHQQTEDREIIGELELDRIQRRLAEQVKQEEALLSHLGEGAFSENGATTEAASTSSGASSSAVPLLQQRRKRTGRIPAATMNRILKHKAEQHEVITYNERLWNTSATSQYAFADRLSAVLLEDLLSEVAYGEVDVMLTEYVEGLADHELRIS